MKQIVLFCLLLACMGQASAQGLPLNEQDRLAILKLDTMGICDGMSMPIPLSGAPIPQSYWLSTEIELFDVTGLNVEWRVVAIRRPNSTAGRPTPLTTTSLYDAFRGDALRHLITLELSGNEITGSLDSFLRDTMPNLRNVYMGNNRLTNINGILTAASGRQLEYVSMHTNRLTSIPPELLTDFTNLRELYFSGNLIDHLPVPADTCNIAPSFVPWTFSCPCYRGLLNTTAILLDTNQLTGTFYPEHFLGKAWEVQANTQLPRASMQFVRINNNQFDDISPALLRSVFDFGTAMSLIQAFLQNTGLQEVQMQNNRLGFDDFYAMNMALGRSSTNLGGLNTYEYAPQNTSPIGIGGVRRRGSGSSLWFELEMEDWAFRYRNNPTGLNAWGITRLDYNWFLASNTTILGDTIAYLATGAQDTTLTNLSLAFAAMAANNIPLTTSRNDPSSLRLTLRTTADVALDSMWIYHEIFSSQFTDLSAISTRRKQIIVAPCQDNDGNAIECQELTIQFDNSGRNDERDAAVRYLEDTLHARKIRDCMCGDVQLWQLSDSTELYANGAGTRSAIPSTRNKPGLRSVDANYSLYSASGSNTMAMPSVSPTAGTTDASRTLVAIIDSGTDPDHPTVSTSIRRNGRETLGNNIDDDGNCIKDDVLGYNFLDNNNVAYDDEGHGTAVAGIAAGIGTPALSATDPSVALLPVKFTNRFGQGTTFEAACAIYYAVDYHRNRGTGVRDDDSVRVINASWGYRGEFSYVLNDAISYAGRRCGVLFVCRLRSRQRRHGHG